MYKINRNIKFLFSFICTILGALGGQGLKFLRRYFIPLILISLAFYKYKNPFVFLLLSLIGCYSLGYGENSFLRKLFNGSNILTRGFISLLKCLSFLILVILSSKWLVYILGGILIISIGSFISWRDLGVIKVFNKELLIVDLIVYGSDSLVGILLL